MCLDDGRVVGRGAENRAEIIGVVAAVAFDLQFDLLATKAAGPPDLNWVAHATGDEDRY